MAFLALVVGIFIGAFVGVVVGVAATRRAYRKREHVDYKERWQNAVQLLGDSGRLSKEEVDQLLGRKASSSSGDGGLSQAQLYKMASWDRAAVAIGRAKRGLPPNDNLKGMASWDVAKVESVRQKYLSRRKA